MYIKCIVAIFLFCVFSAQAQVSITAVNGSKDEIKIKSDLESLHIEYNLAPWLYTKKIHVDDGAKTPHSHPVLTMSTQQEYLNSKVKLLSSYLHEQFHWHVIINGKPTKKAFRARIKAFFPNVKTGYPYGSRDEGSTLTHIIVCYLEYVALTQLIGEDAARKNLSTNGYYTWVYETVLNPNNKQILDNLLAEFGLALSENE